MIKIFIENNYLFINKVNWFFALLIKNHKAEVLIIDNPEHDSINIGFSNFNDVILSEIFYQNIQSGIFNHRSIMPLGPYILNSKGEIDYISSVFYLVNCIQEYAESDLDKFGRFKYLNSLQYRWNIILENLVLGYIEAFCKKYNIKFELLKINAIILSHDIDFFNVGWKHEVLWSIKLKKFMLTYEILYRRFLGNGVFNNIEDLLSLENNFNYNSIYFWLPKNGECKDGIDNADYDINSSIIRRLLTQVELGGSYNGLHKSSFKTTISEEAILVGKGSNLSRFHFLKFTLPDAFDDFEVSGLKIEFSLGFSDHFGYRNSYGLPFKPYCLKEDRVYNFLMVPLHIMDTTLIKHMDLNNEKMLYEICEWVNKVKDHTLISLLWHNNYFSNFSNFEMKNNYFKLLEFLRERNIKTTNPNQLIDLFF